MHLPIFNLKNSRRCPLRFPPARLNPIMSFSAVTTLSAVPQQYMPVLCKNNVIRDNVKISNSGHDVWVWFGIVKRRLARRECGGRAECGVRSAEMSNWRAAFVVFWWVCCGHVFEHDCDVFLDCWISDLSVGVVVLMATFSCSVWSVETLIGGCCPDMMSATWWGSSWSVRCMLRYYQDRLLIEDWLKLISPCNEFARHRGSYYVTTRDALASLLETIRGYICTYCWSCEDFVIHSIPSPCSMSHSDVSRLRKIPPTFNTPRDRAYFS